MTTSKTGLVLGGGGSRGSYEIGVCKALSSVNKTFDLVTGTSIGALCGAMYVSGNMERMESWVADFKQDEVATSLFIFPNQYDTANLVGKPINDFLAMFTKDGPSIAPLIAKYKEIFSYEDFKNSKLEFACAAYNVTQNKPAIFYKKDMTEADVLDKLIASTAYFPCYNLKQVGDDYYLDGGYWNTIPVTIAQDMGAKEIVAVALSDPFADLGIPTDDVTVIRPLLKLASTMDFDGDSMARQVKQGYLEGLKYLDQAPGYIYTFYPDDWEHMLILEKLVLDFMVAKGKISLLEKMPGIMDEIYHFILGYVPQPLKNKYSDQMVFGRILEIMGLVAGVDPYEQIHFKDFMKQILAKFNEFDSNPNQIQTEAKWHDMDLKGLKDSMVFFHSALLSYGMDLPETFSIFKQGSFLLPYYFAVGWILINKFQFI